MSSGLFLISPYLFFGNHSHFSMAFFCSEKIEHKHSGFLMITIVSMRVYSVLRVQIGFTITKVGQSLILSCDPICSNEAVSTLLLVQHSN